MQDRFPCPSDRGGRCLSGSTGSARWQHQHWTGANHLVAELWTRTCLLSLHCSRYAAISQCCNHPFYRAHTAHTTGAATSVQSASTVHVGIDGSVNGPFIRIATTCTIMSNKWNQCFQTSAHTLHWPTLIMVLTSTVSVISQYVPTSPPPFTSTVLLSTLKVFFYQVTCKVVLRGTLLASPASEQNFSPPTRGCICCCAGTASQFTTQHPCIAHSWPPWLFNP